jgi:hypothetical protein
MTEELQKHEAASVAQTAEYPLTRQPDLTDASRYSNNEIAQRMWQTFNVTGDRWFKYAAQRLEGTSTVSSTASDGDVAAGALEPLSEEERLRKVLQNFADQMLTDEMELDSSGDFESAYDIMIKMARSALSSNEGDGVTAGAPMQRVLELLEDRPAAALRALVIEECAKVVDGYGASVDFIADGIRALARRT